MNKRFCNTRPGHDSQGAHGRYYTPGDILREEIEARGWSKKEFAEMSDLTEKDMHLILQGSKPITAFIAKQIAGVLKTSAELWQNLDACYRGDMT